MFINKISIKEIIINRFLIILKFRSITIQAHTLLLINMDFSEKERERELEYRFSTIILNVEDFKMRTRKTNFVIYSVNNRNLFLKTYF